MLALLSLGSSGDSGDLSLLRPPSLDPVDPHIHVGGCHRIPRLHSQTKEIPVRLVLSGPCAGQLLCESLCEELDADSISLPEAVRIINLFNEQKAIEEDRARVLSTVLD